MGTADNPTGLTMQQAMHLASIAYTRNDWAESERLCRLILLRRPDLFEALHLLGVIAAQRQRPQEAAEFLGRAVASRPTDAWAHYRHGLVLDGLKQTEAALLSYQRALELRPEFPEVHRSRGDALAALGRFEAALQHYDCTLRLSPHDAGTCNNRGVALQALKRVDRAVASYDRAVAIKPDYVEAHYNRGLALREAGRFVEAIESYERALALDPNHAEAHNNRGVALQALDRLEEALASYDRALTINPNLAEAHHGRANALNRLRRFEEALASYDRLLKLHPGHAAALNHRGVVLHALNRAEEAVASYDRALTIDPDDAEAHYNRGVSLRELGLLRESLDCYDRALALEPDYVEAHINRADALLQLGLLHQALAAYDRALDVNPDLAGAHYGRANALSQLQRFDEALESYGRAAALEPGQDWLQGVRLLTKMQLCDWSDLDGQIAQLLAGIQSGVKCTPPFPVLVLADSVSLQRKSAHIWAAAGRGRPAAPVLPPLDQRGRHQRIRVAYYSADYYDHATAYLLAELIERHDRARFEVVGFSFGTDRADGMRRRLSAAFDRFLDVRARSDEDIAQLSRALEIDIAVDLKGYTHQERHGIFSLRAAPIQVNYLGYPGTTGAPYMDYLIADPTLIPEENLQGYSEKIVYLPNSYQVNDRKRPIAVCAPSRAELGLPAAAFVFCCFNNHYKIMPATFATWLRILGRVPGSVLWLLGGNATAADNLRREAAAAGVDGARLIFAPRMPLAEHLARHSAADLFLDTLPCGAHTTASDALWAGLPVLTRIGESFAARVSSSLLQAVGLPELITVSEKHYEALALELASSPTRLRTLRSRLAANRPTAPLFDTDSYARHLESAYRQMYERHQAGALPDHIHISK